MKVNEIKDLVNAMSKTDYGYIQVKHEGTEITLSNEFIPTVMNTNQVVPVQTRVDNIGENSRPGASNFSPIESNRDRSQQTFSSNEVDEIVTEERSEDQDSKLVDVENCYIVKAPLVGTFYNAPSPDAKAFVSVGSKVKANDTLCIVEAMKLMNDITAEVSGEIVEILVENEEAVEYGQALFKIRED